MNGERASSVKKRKTVLLEENELTRRRDMEDTHCAIKLVSLLLVLGR